MRNLDFLDGTRGAHASISGVSGVATKTSYATFLLYSLFHSNALGMKADERQKLSTSNVKGESALARHANGRLDARGRAEYAEAGLPSSAFCERWFFAPVWRMSTAPMPDTGGRQEGVNPYLWTMRELAEIVCWLRFRGRRGTSVHSYGL